MSFARFVGARLDLVVQDGYFGFVEHSWLWTGPQPQLIWQIPNILDTYVPGALPQVQLDLTVKNAPVNSSVLMRLLQLVQEEPRYEGAHW